MRTIQAAATADNGNVVGSVDINVSVTDNSYYIAYDANGGSNAPPMQTGLHTGWWSLSSEIPTRPGWGFQGWATSSSGNAIYRPSEGIYISKALTLYAVWARPDFLLPGGLTTIGEEAFLGSAFRYAVVPPSVSSIGSRAFAGCAALRDIYIPGSTYSIASDAFEGVNNLTIHGVGGSYAEHFASTKGYRFVAES